MKIKENKEKKRRLKNFWGVELAWGRNERKNKRGRKVKGKGRVKKQGDSMGRGG